MTNRFMLTKQYLHHLKSQPKFRETILEKDDGQYDTAKQVFWASGASMFVRSEIYKSMRGLDEYFFAHQEEIDFCWRSQLAGYIIMSCPQSKVYHVGGGTLPLSERKAYLNFRNNLVMLAKNWSWSQKLTRIPVRIGLDWLSAIRALLSGDGGFFIGVLKAHLAFISWIFSGKRQNLFPTSKNKNIKGCYSGSVVWQYFIRQKKTFSEIVEEQ